MLVNIKSALKENVCCWTRATDVGAAALPLSPQSVYHYFK